MHPILASRQRQALYLASWAPIALLLAVAWSTASPAVDLGAALVIVAPPGIVHAFVCLSAWYVCRVTPLAARSAPRILAAHTGAGMLAAAVWMLVWEGWTRVLGNYPAFGEPVRDYRSSQAAAVAAAGGAAVLDIESVPLPADRVRDLAPRGNARARLRSDGARSRAQGPARADRSPLPLQQPPVDQRVDDHRPARRPAHVPVAGRLLSQQRASRREGRDPDCGRDGHGPRRFLSRYYPSTSNGYASGRVSPEKSSRRPGADRV